jgi:hypothetical protein
MSCSSPIRDTTRCNLSVENGEIETEIMPGPQTTDNPAPFSLHNPKGKSKEKKKRRKEKTKRHFPFKRVGADETT